METMQSGESNISQNQAERIRRDAKRPRRSARAHEAAHEAYEQQVAKDWVREHQDIAIIAAFAFGLFMGVWMKG